MIQRVALFILLLSPLLSARAQTAGCSRTEPGWRCPDAFAVVPASSNPYTFESPGYSGNGNALLNAYAGNRAAGYQYAVYYGAGNTSGRIRRPVVVVDGIDVGFSFGNGRSADEIFNTLLNRNGVVINGQPAVNVRLGDDVIADGYDVVILDYGDALDFIERNSLALVDLLTRIDAQLAPGEQIQAVVGPSMGALVARYALAYIERNNLSPRVSLYVSFDGAHQGGHIPIGIQQTADDITHHSDFSQFYPANFSSQVDAVFRAPAVRELLAFNAFAASYTQNPSNPAFRQDPLRTGLLTGLLALGDYPAASRKVAIVNGSPSGLSQLRGDGSANRVTAGNAQFTFDAYFTYGIGGFRTLMESFAAPLGSDAGTVYRRRDYTCNLFCRPAGIPVNPSPFNPAPWSVASGPLDSAPGGWRDTGRSVAAPFATVYSWSDVVDRTRSFDLGALVDPALYYARQLLANGNVHLAVSAPTPNHAFVSTVSALDYNTTGASRAALVQSVFAGQNLSRNILADVQSGTAAPRTPFDGFYLAGDDGVEGRENQEHIALTPGVAAYVRGELARSGPVSRLYAASATVAGDALPAGSTVTLGDNVGLIYTGPVSAAAGVTFRMGLNARITFLAPVTAVGTLAAPVQFVRANPADAWDRLTIAGDGSLIEQAVVEGGTRSVEVAARGVIVRATRITGGWRGISSYFTLSGTRSEVALQGVTVEGSLSVGVVLDHTDAAITGSVIRGNAQAGLWVRDGRVTVASSLIEDNGLAQSWRDGIEAYSGAEVVADTGGRNTVRTNGRYELAAFSGARVYAGTRLCPDLTPLPERGSAAAPRCYGGGYNTFSDARGGELVYNGSGSPLPAQMNYWGGVPAASSFVGSVTYTPYLSLPPALSAVEEVYPVVVVRTDALSATERLVRYRHHPDAEAERWADAVPALERAASDGDESAARALVAQSLADGDYARARTLVQSVQVVSDEGRTEMALASVTLYEQAGQIAEALRALDAIAAALPPGLYATLRETLSGEVAGGGVTAAVALASPPRAAVRGIEVYPNPSRGEATLSLSLQDDARCLVEIFAADGRRVGSVTEENLAAGQHALRLPVASLAAGVYVVRVQVGDEAITSKRFVIVR